MDLITYSYASKVNKRIDRLNFLQDSEPNNPEEGAVWFKTDTGQIFKAVPDDSGTLVWVDITPQGLASTKYNEVYEIGTPKDNYDGSKNTISCVNFNADNIEVFLNGVLLTEGVDYVINNDTKTINLINDAKDGDILEIISFENLSLSDSPRVEGGFVKDYDKKPVKGIHIVDTETGEKYNLIIQNGDIVLQQVNNGGNE